MLYDGISASRQAGVMLGLLLSAAGAVGAGRPGGASCAVSDEALLYDWMLQDHGLDVRVCFADRSGCEVEAKMLARVVAELGPEGRAFGAEAGRLAAAGVAGVDPRWRALYVRACRLRRARRLAPLLAKYPRVVFTKHYNLGGSHYAYTEGQSDAQAERHFEPGSALCLLEADAGTGRVRTVLADPNGVIRDPDVSYDGRRILFAWKKSDRGDDYHLYEMDAATGRVRQLTFGEGVADYEGVYLPDGDILFNSTRCVQTVDCFWTEVSNLYRCDADGRFLRRVTFDQVHTNYPTVTDDGRVLYTRWDYNDRGQIFPQPLFQMNLDGTGQTAVYGNNSWFPTTILHARAIPGTGRIVAVLSGHHCHQRGKLAIIDPARGREEASGVQLIAPVRETKPVRIDAYGQTGEQFQYPYPVTERTFLVACEPHDNANRRYVRPFGLYLVDVDGRRELLAWDGKISCNQPVPLAGRPRPAVRPASVDYRKTTGVFYVQDVYAGGGLRGVARGTVRRLRVVALEFRAAGIGRNGSRGPAGGATASTPVSVRNGSWDVKRVLGTVPVCQDGSAMFLVPARTPVYFQLLDERGCVVQSMRSWSTLQPGETFSCVGCHETPSEASPPVRRVTDALRAGPRRLEPFYGPPRGFSFPREIQPILDRHCIRCHNDRAKRPGAEADPAEASFRDATVLTPLQDRWLYTTEEPPTKKWCRPGFDAAGWKTGRAGFGTRTFPESRPNTRWRTPAIWLRKTFTLPENWSPQGKVAALRICYDEDPEVFLNGRRVLKKSGFIGEFLDLPVDVCLLRPGENTLAARCRQTHGGQFIDLALLVAPDPARRAADAPAEPTGPDGTKKAFSLLGEPNLDKQAKRYFSDAYLALTQNGRPNRLVNWLNVQSIPPMLPPYYAGAARSELISMLEKAHNNVRLSREEMDKLACWIDLLVPYCGSYTEAAAWSDAERAKYARYQAKRDRLAAAERENIRAYLAGRNKAR